MGNCCGSVVVWSFWFFNVCIETGRFQKIISYIIFQLKSINHAVVIYAVICSKSYLYYSSMPSSVHPQVQLWRAKYLNRKECLRLKKIDHIHFTDGETEALIIIEYLSSGIWLCNPSGSLWSLSNLGYSMILEIIHHTTYFIWVEDLPLNNLFKFTR